jgi:peptidoglycan/LPS O-acetylase OafA/YrhL
LAISRLIAALIVVVSHFMQFGLIPRNEFFLSKFHGGGIAVTYFFVLSGFILAHNYSGAPEKFNLKKYFINRVSRIFPMLFFSGIMCGSIVLFLGEVYEYNQKSFVPLNLSKGIFAGFSQVFGLSAWLPFSAVQGVLNAPSWSIGCEVFFYLTFPFVLKFVFGFYSKKISASLIFLNLACLSAMFVLTMGNQSNRASLLLDRFPLFHLMEFTLGVVAYRFFLRNPRIEGVRWKLPGSFILLALSIVFLESRYFFLILAPIYSLIIYILSGTFANKSKGFFWRIMVSLGNASYSLYLLHWGIGIALITNANNILVKTLCIPGVLLISLISLRFIENPARSRLILILNK